MKTPPPPTPSSPSQMQPGRRDFLRTAALGAAALPFARAATAQEPAASRTAPNSGANKKLLILGGTRFLGPAVVEAAPARGWEITGFNRGKTNPHLFPEVDKRVGDRDAKLESLEDGEWDACIDTSGYVPRHVKLSAELLADRVGHYVFVSTVSVFDDKGEALDEDSPVHTMEDPTEERVTGRTYGPLKALCEQAAEAAMPGRVSNIRPGLIVGPHDNSGRGTYWPVRTARGGEILTPGNPKALVEFIDVRDLAEFLIECCEQQLAGVYIANGPGVDISMEEYVYGCKVVVGGDCTFTWVPDDFLVEEKVGAYSEMPMWMPASMPNSRNISTKARAVGLKGRPVGDTIRDTLAWSHTGEDYPASMRRTLNAERETELLAAWHAAQK